jgi:tetratricopeptide (TPR) repeat protein
MCQYKQGEFTDAAKNFEKAAKINPASPEAQMNQGISALLDDNYNVAKQKLGNAAGLEELNDALGAYYIKTGDYNAANNAFGKTVSNNAALAKILSKDYSGAKQVLANIAKPNATTYYLMAVLGARTNNEQMVTSNLRQAVKLDASLADRAKNDLEFAKINLSNAL